MFSNLTEEMKQNLETNLPKSAFTDKDDMIPVMADPKVLGEYGARPAIHVFAGRLAGGLPKLVYNGQCVVGLRDPGTVCIRTFLR